jgi:hypothetical protein
MLPNSNAYKRNLQTMSIESNGSNEEILITRVPRVRREPLTPFDGRYAEPIAETSGELEKLWQLTTAEKAILTYKDLKLKTLLVIALTPHVFTIIKGRLMKNWKTTITGIVGALAVLAQSIFGIVVPQEAIIAVTLFVVSLFASDSSK